MKSTGNVTQSDNARLSVTQLYLRSRWRTFFHRFFKKLSPLKAVEVNVCFTDVAGDDSRQQASLPEYGFTLVFNKNEGTVKSESLDTSAK